MKNAEHELDWLAFRYVAGEMNAEEAASFEERLADDQPARDAVVKAVELSQTIMATQSMAVEAVGRSSSNWSQRISWFALGAAASWLLVFVVGMSRLPRESSMVSAELAAAWSDRSEVVAEEDSPEETSDDEAIALAATDDEEALDSLASEVPDWMMEGIADSEASQNHDSEVEPAPQDKREG